MHALDELAESLRGRLVERARETGGDQPVERQVRELVASEAAALPDPERERLAERVAALVEPLVTRA